MQSRVQAMQALMSEQESLATAAVAALRARLAQGQTPSSAAGPPRSPSTPPRGSHAPLLAQGHPPASPQVKHSHPLWLVLRLWSCPMIVAAMISHYHL